MGIIRGGFIFFAGILLLISLILGNLFLTMNLSLNYENVKSGFVDAVKKEIGSNLGSSDSIMKQHCKNNLEYSLNLGVYDLGSVSVPCEIISQGQDAVLNYVIEKYAEKKYYQEYDCNLFDCPMKTLSPMVYVSQHAKNYYVKIFYYSIIMSLILIALMSLLIEDKKRILFDVGTLMIISSLPLLILGWFVSRFKFADILFSEASFVFWIIFIPGIILATFGVGLKFWKFDSEEKGDDSKKENVKEEVVEEKPEFVKKKSVKTGKK